MWAYSKNLETGQKTSRNETVKKPEFDYTTIDKSLMILYKENQHRHPQTQYNLCQIIKQVKSKLHLHRNPVTTKTSSPPHSRLLPGMSFAPTSLQAPAWNAVCSQPPTSPPRSRLLPGMQFAPSSFQAPAWNAVKFIRAPPRKSAAIKTNRYPSPNPFLLKKKGAFYASFQAPASNAICFIRAPPRKSAANTGTQMFDPYAKSPQNHREQNRL